VITDEIKEVFAVEPLHDNVEAVIHLEVVDEPDDPRHIADLLHQSHLEQQVVVAGNVDFVGLGHFFHGNFHSITDSNC